MAVLTPADLWSDVYKIDTADPVKGGTVSGAIDAPTDGHTNAPLQGLANRTQFLYNRLTPIGTMAMWPTSTAPTGWLVCDGSQVSRTTYSALFAVIGTVFGQGNGTTTFHLPDARGRFPRGYSGLSGLDPDAASRTAMNAGGATGNNIGTVQDDAFEAHSHTVNTEAGLNGPEAGAVPDPSGSTTPTTFNTGESGTSTETRPKNFAINFIIRADY